MNDKIRLIIDKLIASGYVNRDDIWGCTLEEVNELEKRLNINLPSIFREFLLHMGKRIAGMFEGEAFFYNSIMILTEQFRPKVERVDDDGSFIYLPLDALVFYAHDVTIYAFVYTQDELDDPPVYYIGDFNNFQPEKFHEHFSDYLLMVAEQYIEFCNRIQMYRQRRLNRKAAR